MKNYLRIGIIVSGLCVLVAGCRHADSLYREAPRPPLQSGREYERQHDYAAAEQSYTRIDNVIVQDMALNHLAAAWESVNASLIRSQAAVAQQPASATARLQLAQDYYTKGLLCTRYMTGIVGEYPRDFVIGEQEFFYTAALEQARKVLQLQADVPEAYLLIGEIYLANFRSEEALQELKRLIAKHPDFARGYYAIGKIYHTQKKEQLVERYLIRALKLDPNLLDAYYLLGKFYLEQQWYDFAAFTFLELLDRNPQDGPALDLFVEACHQIGKQYLEHAQYDQAIRMFQEALRVKSSYPIHQSLVLARQKKAEAALAAALAPAAEAVEAQSERAPAIDLATFTALLYADQALENVLFTQPFDDAELNQTINLFRESRIEEGHTMLTAAINKTGVRTPFRIFALASAQQALDNPGAAVGLLRPLVEGINVESRIQLWAWKALRGLEQPINPAVVSQVLGVVVETSVPEQQGVSILAAYADGRVRYVNFDGGILISEQLSGTLADLARGVIQQAQPVARDFPPEVRRLPVRDGNVRMSLLTPNGIRVLEDTRINVDKKISVMSPVFATATNLMNTLTDGTQKGLIVYAPQP